MVFTKHKKVHSWGRYPDIDATVISTASIEEIRQIASASDRIIARGNGRSYGDSSLAPLIFSTSRLNKFIDFNTAAGLMTCESGVLFEDILSVAVPKGFFLPVTPGTKFITIGGAIASNIHGKNHHKEGSFCDYIEWLEIITEDAKPIVCSRTSHSELFFATCGGMGLTGIITKACFKLKTIETSYIKQKTIKAQDLDTILTAFDTYSTYTYSVAWIDCLAKGKNLGRSLLMVGEHACKRELPANLSTQLLVPKKTSFTMPGWLPSGILNSLSVRLFNFLFYHKVVRQITDNFIDYDRFFYPLDAVQKWNRIYGKKGFVQYQFIIPRKGGNEVLREILTQVAESGQASFLAVLKLFGKENLYAPINFPSEGYTLAMDFKVDDNLWPLLNHIDKLVSNMGGRIYLTKDARMSKEIFNQMYPSVEIYKKSKFASFQSDRLGITK